MTVGEAGENGVINGVDGASHKKTARVAELAQRFGMAKQVLDFDGDVITKLGKFSVHGFDDRESVRGAVEEIGIAEGDVLGACTDLPADVFEYDFSLHDAEDSVINGHDR